MNAAMILTLAAPDMLLQCARHMLQRVTRSGRYVAFALRRARAD